MTTPRLSPLSWSDALLHAPITPAFQSELPEFLKTHGTNFLSRIAEHPSAALTQQADAWYATQDGQDTLVALVDAIWEKMTPLSAHAMPAHDARHAMFKVPASALEYVHHEQVTGFERVGVLGALLHDIGRWAEERIFGGPGPGMLHARMSWLLSEELLAPFAMPEVVREQVLQAVIRHTSGAVETDPMTLKLTVAADRDQLYGPEMVLRLMHHLPESNGNLSRVYAPSLSVLDRLCHFLCHRLPGPLYGMQAHVDWLWEVLYTFVLMAEPEQVSHARFSALLPTSRRAQTLAQRDWQSDFELAATIAVDHHGAQAEFEQLITSANTAPSPAHRAAALRKLDGLSAEQHERLGRALAWVRQAQTTNDLRQDQALHAWSASPSSDTFTRHLAQVLRGPSSR